MNGIFICTPPPESLRPLTGPHPRVLLNVADSTILGHLVGHPLEAITGTLTMMVPDEAQGPIRVWLAEKHPQVAPRFVAYMAEQSPWTALVKADVIVDEEPTLLMTDGMIVLADYDLLPEQQAEAVALSDTAVFVKNGRQLTAVLNAPDAPTNTTDLINALNAQPTNVHRRLPINTPAEWVQANARLLGLGYSSDDALERSYTEEFAVIPPVYIHPTAEIFASVVGPYASIGAGALVEDAVIKNSVVQAGSRVQNCVLDGALVGTKTNVTGSAHELHAGPEQSIIV